MPDISMCKGKDCPLKENCYRYTATPSCYQTFFVNPPYNREKRECDYYWENKKYKENDK